MKNSIVVSNTTAIIYIPAIGAMRLVEFLFSKICIPLKVFHELTRYEFYVRGEGFHLKDNLYSHVLVQA